MSADPCDGEAPLPPLARIPAVIAAVADYEAFAHARVRADAWAYLNGGAGDGLAHAANLAAFRRVRLRGRVLANVKGGHTRVSLFGQTLDFPVLVAPVAYQKLVHPQGEAAMLAGASAMRAAMVVSTEASTPLEDLARQAVAPLWFQLYLQADRAFTTSLVRRVEDAGYRALVVTADAPLNGPRNAEQRAGFRMPPGIEAVNLRGMRTPPAGLAQAGQSPIFGSGYLASAATWEDIAWLRALTGLPILLKGVMTAEDAQLAIDAKLDGIIVSNHGGRVLDAQPATIDVLPEIAAAVADRVPLLLDGGIRRGTDVLAAIACGASAVLVGRPCVHALAAAGASGVAHVLHLLRTELEMAMVLTGCSTLADANPAMIFRPTA